MKPLVYVAAPYTQPDPVLNVRAAIDAGDFIRRHGGAPLIPHLSMLWHLVSPKPLEEWYALDLDLLEHCNAVLRVPGDSAGADTEVASAIRRGIPVFEWPFCAESLPEWIARWSPVRAGAM